MRHIFSFFITLGVLFGCYLPSYADDYDDLEFATATFTDIKGEEVTPGSEDLSAPITGSFSVSAIEKDGYTANYVWTVSFHALTESTYREEPYLVRYGEQTEITFTESGVYNIICTATLVNGMDTIRYTQEVTPTLTLSTSKLEMPNAFSPNGDGTNDVYKAKSTYRSIVEFRGIIFNRWGQKLFEWTDIDSGWDGTYNGHPVKDGVYYCMVKARGADGTRYSIKRDVNLLRGYNESDNSSTTDQ